jgi:hypothetical protein
VKLLYLAFLEKYSGMTLSANKARSLTTKARPCGSHSMIPELWGSDSISMRRCGKIFESSSLSMMMMMMKAAGLLLEGDLLCRLAGCDRRSEACDTLSPWTRSARLRNDDGRQR